MAQLGSGRPRTLLASGLQLAVLLLIAVAMLAPLFWLVSTSLKGPGENIFTSPPALLPSQPSLEAYQRLFADNPMLGYIRNSAIVSGLAVLANLLFCSLAAYPLARMRFAGRGVVLALVAVMQGFSLSTAMKGFRDTPVKDSLVYVTFHTPLFWFYFLFIFPLITMRLFAEEERSLQPTLMTPLRHLIAQFKGIDDGVLGLYGAFGYDLLFPVAKTLLALDIKDPGDIGTGARLYL